MNIRKVVFDRFLPFVAIGIFFVLSIPVQAQQPSTQPIPDDPQLQPDDPLSPLNAAFRTAYADLRSQIITQTSPIIVHFGDKMALIKDGVHTEAPSFTPPYHVLKAVAHVPLALYVMVVAGRVHPWTTPDSPRFDIIARWWRKGATRWRTRLSP
jgi:hypothetical protein